MQEQQIAYDQLLKIIIVGSEGVGKTAVLSRFVNNQFVQKYMPTIGVQFATKKLAKFDKNFKLQIWDTAGQQRFKSITNAYFNNSVGVLFVFDLTNRKSFQQLIKIVPQVIASNGGKARAVLVANKTDLADRCVSEDEVREFSERIGPYFEISCKQGIVSGPFEQLVNDISNQHPTLQSRWNGQVAPSQKSWAAPEQIFMKVEAKHTPIIEKHVTKTNFQNPHLLKLIIVGCTETGKSSMLWRYADDSFNESYIATIGIDFKIKTFQKNGLAIKMQMWDTAGQQRFRTIASSYYKGTNVVILVYDRSKAQTFNNLGYFLKQIQKNCNQKVHKVLVANKCELPSEVSTQTGQAFAAENGFAFYQVSAKENVNITQMFEQLAYKAVSLP